MDKEVGEKIASRDLPALKQLAKRLLRLSKSILAKSRFDETNDFSFMLQCFLVKQQDHLKSLLLLKTKRDTVLIARTMLEGLCQLLWTAKNHKALAERWRKYAFVFDWRVLNDRKEKNIPIENGDEERILSGLSQTTNTYYSGRAKHSIKNKQPLPTDPYDYSWTGSSAHSIFSQVAGKDLYDEVYRPASDWLHWNCSGIGNALSKKGPTYIYKASSHAEAAISLSMGIYSLLKSLVVFDQHFSLGKINTLERFYKDYLEVTRGPENSSTVA